MANLTILLNSLLLFLLFVEDRFVVPGVMQVAGRMHPLVLHFPIVLIVLYAVYNLFLVRKQDLNDGARRYADMILLYGALTAALSALMGLFLSREEGYDAGGLQWHKITGVIVSLFTMTWYFARVQIRKRKITRWLVSLIALALVIITGHEGAGITHGEDFLFEPLQKEKAAPDVAMQDAMVFDHVIQPIFETKCVSCHSTQKSKGDLVLETREQILQGGKSGLLWDAHQPGEALLLTRINLHMEEKKHMPPKGKPQLSQNEIRLLHLWIEKGASFDMKLSDLNADDELYQLASSTFKTTGEQAYNFEAADGSLLQSLNTENRVVQPEAANSPAVAVNFFNASKFESSQLKELSKIKQQVVSLDLARMPLNADDIKTISQLENLRRLNLSFTPITSNDLHALKSLKNLRSLSVSGTNINVAELNILKEWPALQQVYAWKLNGSEDEWTKLKNSFPNMFIETGFSGDSIVLKLSTPVFENDKPIISGPTPLRLKHYIQGAEIRYTLDGSEPDSINSFIYKGDELVDQNVLIRARAYKKGWQSSDLMEASLYKRTFVPDSIVLLTQPHPSYSLKAKQLIDLEKGELSYMNGNWFGWRTDPMQVLMLFSTPKPISSLNLSVLVDINSYIMPPLGVEIWGGMEENNLRKLGSITPQQPSASQPAYMRGYECRFEKTEVKYLKLIAQPVRHLPSWHRGKGDKGWVFVDEILLN